MGIGRCAVLSLPDLKSTASKSKPSIWVDPLGGPTKWVMARKNTLLDLANFLALVNAFVSGRYGSIVVIEAGPADTGAVHG